MEGPTSKGRGGEERKKGGKGMGGEMRKKEGKGKGRGKGGRGWPDQSKTHCFGSVILIWRRSRRICGLLRCKLTITKSTYSRCNNLRIKGLKLNRNDDIVVHQFFFFGQQTTLPR